MSPKSKPQAKSKTKTKIKTTKAKKATLLPDSPEQWRIHDDARTLKQAIEIKNDPGRLKAAQEYAAKEMDALKKIAKMK